MVRHYLFAIKIAYIKTYGLVWIDLLELIL